MRNIPHALILISALFSGYIMFQAGVESKELQTYWQAYVGLCAIFVFAPSFILFLNVSRRYQNGFSTTALTGALTFCTWYLGYYGYLHGDYTSRAFIFPIIWFVFWLAVGISAFIPRDAYNDRKEQ